MVEQPSASSPLAYRTLGVGRPVVLLHAFPLACPMWHPQAAGLQGDFQVLTPDLRGFGDSPGFDQTPPSVDTMADDVAALLDHLSLHEPVVLGGLSMGGYVALAFARRHASRLRGLILADTRSGPDTAEGKANRDRMILLVRERGPQAVIEQMLPRLLGATTHEQHPEVTAEVQALAARQSVEGIAGALQALRDRPDAGPALASIGVPTLVLVGSEDVLTPPEAARELAQAIPGAQLHVLPNAGHLANLEQPDAFTQTVRRFLQSL